MADVNAIGNTLYGDNITDHNHFNYKERPMPPPVYEKSGGEGDVVEANRIFQQLQDKIYNGSVKHLTVFKKFDLDQDGYVSKSDFENALKRLNISASE